MAIPEQQSSPATALPMLVKKLNYDELSSLVIFGGARGVVVIVVGNGHGDTSSNTGRDWLHFI